MPGSATGPADQTQSTAQRCLAPRENERKGRPLLAIILTGLITDSEGTAILNATDEAAAQPNVVPGTEGE